MISSGISYYRALRLWEIFAEGRIVDLNLVCTKLGNVTAFSEAIDFVSYALRPARHLQNVLDHQDSLLSHTF